MVLYRSHKCPPCLHHKLDCCQIRKSNSKAQCPFITSMSTAAFTERASGCGLSMRQSSMLILMTKPFMSILRKTEDIRYIILTHRAYCDFQSPGFRKGPAQQNKSIHIFRCFQKQIRSQNPEDDASDNYLIVLYVLRTFMLQHATLQPKSTQISDEYLCFPYCTRGSTRQYPFGGKLSCTVKVWSGM